MNSVKSGLFILLTILTIEVPLIAGSITPVDAYKRLPGNCKWDSVVVTYFVDTINLIPNVHLAAMAWRDMPALVTLGETFDLKTANIHVKQIDNPNLAARGITLDAFSPAVCRNGSFVRQLTIELNWAVLKNDGQDLRTQTAIHEFGHTLGLDESPVVQSTMYGFPDNYDQYGIFVPVIDDIKGLASIYGWADYTRFGSVATSGEAVATGTAVPLTLQVYTSSSGTYAKVYSSTTLPSSGINILMGWVTPLTLYRFNIGWEEGPTLSGITFAAVELDNDGVKLTSSVFVPQSVAISETINPNTSYFVEIVVEVLDGDPNRVRAAVFVFKEAPPVQGSVEPFLGHLTKDLINFLGESAFIFQRWSDAKYFEAAVWTDAGNNPESRYNLLDFWNFQGTGQKFPTSGSGNGFGCAGCYPI